MFEGVLAQLQPPETSVMPNFDLFASRLKNLVSTGIVNTSAIRCFGKKSAWILARCIVFFVAL